ncbi:MAG: c-type cytochrome [Candidatus Bathyanammoxibius sp.]
MSNMIFTVTFICCVILFVCPVRNAVAEVDAASMFKQHCTPCHGEDGRGTDLGKQLAAMAEGIEFPDFTSADWQAKKTDERMIEQIKNGSPDRMFPFKDKLSEEEINVLVVYVRGFPSR